MQNGDRIVVIGAQNAQALCEVFDTGELFARRVRERRAGVPVNYRAVRATVKAREAAYGSLTLAAPGLPSGAQAVKRTTGVVRPHSSSRR